MPIYEYYCQPCHTIFSFFARSTAAVKPPKCPKCGAKKLEKQVSQFAISKGLQESDSSAADDPFANVDDSKMDQIMAEMASSMGDEDGQGGEEDPRKLASVMKKFFDAAGMKPNDAMVEAMRRMESGEDPDKIDEELGDALDADDPFNDESSKLKKRIRRMLDRPKVDPELYDF